MEEKELLKELAMLVRTAGGICVAEELQKREKVDPATVIGKGKVEELKKVISEKEIDLVIFNLPLSGSQKRNLEALLGVRVIDRVEVIMDIFAQHARTKEAKLQVMWAQLSYRLSRLKGAGTELSRLGGGIGTRGPGEQKIEVDRRSIRKRLARISMELKEIEKNRALQRKSRKRQRIPVVSLVGYTNSGKSTLLSALSRSEVLVEDALFSTLDPLTRRVYLKEGKSILVSDTVGFIRRLPPNLVAAFRATLEELRDSDLLLHLVDVSSDNLEEHINAVESVLSELKLDCKPRWILFNKADLIDEETLENLTRRYPDSIAISALKGYNLDTLKERLYNYFFEKKGVVETVYPEYDRIQQG